MAYAVKRRGAKYQVVNSETGEARPPTTKARAERELTLLNRIERDWTHEGNGVYSREVNGRTVRMRVQ